MHRRLLFYSAIYEIKVILPTATYLLFIFRENALCIYTYQRSRSFKDSRSRSITLTGTLHSGSTDDEIVNSLSICLPMYSVFTGS